MADLSQLKLPNNQTYNIKDSAAVKAVTWDTTNKKITKTINGTTTDVVTGKTILDGMTSTQVTTALGYTPPDQPTKSTSGAVATFEAANLPMPKLIASIEPQQDLHGYDSPWVGGSGKNKFDATTLMANVNSSVQYVTITLKPNTTYTMSTSLGKIDNVCNLFFMLPNESASSATNGVYSGLSISVTSGNDGQVKVGYRLPSDGTTSAQYLAKQYQIEEGNQATSYAPYSNECPISGWTACNVARTGKNILNPSIRHYSSPYAVWGGSLTSNVPDGTLILEAGEYTFSVNQNVAQMNVRGNPDTPIVRVYNTNVMNFTLNSKTAVKIAVEKSSSQDIDNLVFQLELGSSPSTYEPFGNTYTINFVDGSNPLTVYSGTLDVVSGELTVDRVSVDLGTLYWSYSTADERFFTTSIKDIKKVMNATTVMNGLCSHYDIVAYQYVHKSTALDGVMGLYSTSTTNYLAIKDTRYTDATSFKTAMNGVQLVYELATPQTYYINVDDLPDSLEGVNNIWADTGEVLNAEYVTKEYNDIIGELRGEIVEAGTTVTQSIAGSDSYNILMSGSNDDYGSTTLTETVKKATSLKYNNGGSMLILENGDFDINLCVGGLSNISVGKQKVITGTSNKYKHYIDYKSDDITMHTNNSSYPNTWDGTNTSLKTAVNAKATIVAETIADLAFSSGVATIAKKTGYILINVYPYNRSDNVYGIISITEQTDGSYKVRNNTTSLSTSLNVRVIWLKTS